MFRLQQEIINLLCRLKEYHPEKFVRFIGLCKQSRIPSSVKWINVLRKQGVSIPQGESSRNFRSINFPEIILEQISEDGTDILNLLGLEFYDHHAPYGLTGWVAKRGRGDNFLRTAYAAQPRALKEGDILLTGERVLCPPRDGGNGRVLVKVSGRIRGTWLDFPSGTAIALLPSFENVPPGLIE
ncbi:hypothetical protein IPH92_04730 [Candidatus Kaiserbacteria bacterium]|nr:MAG: hypothetical protein IPH92_04730 [Candidatus Kaiserbacteria bacterium]